MQARRYLHRRAKAMCAWNAGRAQASYEVVAQLGEHGRKVVLLGGGPQDTPWLAIHRRSIKWLLEGISNRAQHPLTVFLETASENRTKQKWNVKGEFDVETMTFTPTPLGTGRAKATPISNLYRAFDDISNPLRILKVVKVPKESVDADSVETAADATAGAHLKI